jgi:hypothetical protein
MLIIGQLGPSIVTTTLILIGVLQGCTFIGGGIILLIIAKNVMDKSKFPNIMSPTRQGHHNSKYISINNLP